MSMNSYYILEEGFLLKEKKKIEIQSFVYRHSSWKVPRSASSQEVCTNHTWTSLSK